MEVVLGIESTVEGILKGINCDMTRRENFISAKGPRSYCVCVSWINSMFRVWTWISLLFIPSLVSSAEEQKLYLNLFKDYVPHVRPRINPSETVTITIRFNLEQIKELNEQSQVLQTVGFLESEWHDDFLYWDPKNYSGIREITVPPEKIWLPDFGLYNSAESFYQEDLIKNFRVIVTHTGRILWSVGGVFVTTCTIDTVLFPFDIQSCPFDFVNWAYTNLSVNLINGSSVIQLDNYHTNGIWNLSYTEVELYAFPSGRYSDASNPMVRFLLHIQRKPRYYLVNILLPCFFLTSIALLVFWLPPEAGEKVSLGVTVLLAFSVFQLVIADSTPENSDSTPLLGIFVALTMALSTVSVVSTVLVLYLHHKSPNYRVPRWIHFVAFSVLSRVFCIRLTNPNHQNDVFKDANNASANSSQLLKATDADSVEMNVVDNPGDTVFPTVTLRSLSRQVEQVTTQLKLLAMRIHLREEEKEVIEEWQAVAKVLDRLLFWIALIVLSVALAWLMYIGFTAKHKFDVK